MKIMAQDKDAIFDTTGADIFLDDDGTWYYVKLQKCGKLYALGGYLSPEIAADELENIFKYLREKKGTYRMRKDVAGGDGDGKTLQ